MPLPNFTDDEQYLVNSIKAPNAAGKSSSYMWSYLVGAVTFAGFGVYHENVLTVVSAFVVVLGFRIYEERQQTTWLNSQEFRGTLEKPEVLGLRLPKRKHLILDRRVA